MSDPHSQLVAQITAKAIDSAAAKGNGASDYGHSSR